MARGTLFGDKHSSRHLRLIQAKVEIQPAKPKLNFIDVPGADGAKDFSEYPAGRVVYETRELTWTFKLYPGENWAAKYTEVCSALHGKSLRITLDDDPDYYYQGRVYVDQYTTDSILHTVTVVAICQPYKLKQSPEVMEGTLTTTSRPWLLVSGNMPAVPTFTAAVETTVVWKDNTYTLAPGTHKILDIVLDAGVNTLSVKSTSGTGTLTVEWQEGWL